MSRDDLAYASFIKTFGWQQVAKTHTLEGLAHGFRASVQALADTNTFNRYVTYQKTQIAH